MDASSIQRLLSADAFPHEITRHELVETHISWVILTGDIAYKVKKPVNFGFVDFSTLARREHFCHREVELNRRYTPEIYLGVVPVTGSLEEPQIDGEGPVIDHAVKMVQFNTLSAAYMPCRIAVVEDQEGQVWLMMLNLDMLINSKLLPPEVTEIAIRVNQAMLDVMVAGATGEF